MKQTSKAVLIAFLILISLTIPLYFYTRPPALEAGTIQISGNINNPQNLTLTQLEALPTTTLQATLTSSGNPADNGNFNYTGVLLREILNQSQVSANATSLYIQASDGYGTTLSLEEAKKDNVLIACQKNGIQLTDVKTGGEGPLRLIINGDTYAQRWVKGVVSIKVV